MNNEQKKLFKRESGLILVDSHVHTAGIEFLNFFLPCLPFAQSTKDLIKKMDSSGIDKAIALPMSFPLYYDPRKVISKNEWVQTNLEDFPYQTLNNALLLETKEYKDRMFPFFAFDPREKIKEQIDFTEKSIIEERIFGLKLHTRSVNSNAQALDKTPFVDLLEKYGLPIIFHTGCDRTSSPLSVIEFAKKHPKIRVSIAHIGRFNQEALSEARKLDNVFVDTAPLLTLCKYARDGSGIFQDRFKTDYKEPVKVLVDLAEYLRHKLIWGTDEPWTAIMDASGRKKSDFSYEDECQALFELVNIGRVDLLKEIASINPLKFIFGE